MSKQLSVKLSRVFRKTAIVERLVCMVQFGCVRWDEADSEDLSGLSYITPEVKEKLRGLPSFLSVASWTKTLEDFTFMNVLIYLVFGRDKTFDMQSMRAFKFLRAYRFFEDGFVNNVWLFTWEGLCSIRSQQINPSELLLLWMVTVLWCLFSTMQLCFRVSCAWGSDSWQSMCPNWYPNWFLFHRLGQACNNVAAVLFYLEHHCSQGMKSCHWFCPKRPCLCSGIKLLGKLYTGGSQYRHHLGPAPSGSVNQFLYFCQLQGTSCFFSATIHSFSPCNIP